MKLVIVESPGKINKIKTILGPEYTVIASCGHIMDLDPKKLSVDVKNDFTPTYIINDDKKDIVKKMLSEYKKAETVFIATDRDREGEMIAWSIANQLKIKNPMRISFNSITKTAILTSIGSPGKINNFVVSAQKTRRILDRIVGYKLSPLLSSNFDKSLSAGRVQSVVTKLIVEKESLINEFFKKDSTIWHKFVASFYDLNKKVFSASLYAIPEKTMENNNSSENSYKKGKVAKIMKKNIKPLLKKMIKSQFSIGDIENNKSISKPSPPFITSTLQQEASSKLGFASKKTMFLAQHLYEAGYITYMRTDSTYIAKEAILDIKEFILSTFGVKYSNVVEYANKNNNSQEAHEAIRPTAFDVTELKCHAKIQMDECKLYTLIWNRTIASQMTPANFNIKAVQINISKLIDYFYLAQVQTIIFDGFLRLYNSKKEKNESISIPDIGETIGICDIIVSPMSQSPPSRFNEASLIKKLDVNQLNIGRPSTYSSIINIILDRGYITIKNIDGFKKDSVIYSWKISQKDLINEEPTSIFIGRESNKFVPTILGSKITKYLNEHFSFLMEYAFTSDIEGKLDLIADGKTSSIDVLKKFYTQFQPTILKLSVPMINPNSHVIGLHPIYHSTITASKNKYGPALRLTNNDVPIYSSIIKPFTIANMTLPHAIRAFDFPINLGEYLSHDIIFKKSSYGFYLTWNSNNYPVTLDTIQQFDDFSFLTASTLISQHKKKTLWNHTDDNKNYSIKDGPYGNYLSVYDKKTKKNTFISLPPNFKIKDITFDTIQNIIKNNKTKTKTKTKTKIKK